MKKLKFIKGFTLIELLVVIAIIGILASIVYAPFQTARRKGRDAQKVIEMRNLLTSINLYADGNSGNFPKTLVDLDNYQVDPLPPKANLSAVYDPQAYNYQPFFSQASQGGVVLGFHLWTHLETNNGALAGAAKCDGIDLGSGGIVGNVNSNPQASSTCIHLNTGSAGIAAPGSQVGGGTYPPNFTQAARNADPAKGDTDQNCATDMSACILDYHQ